jgi:hypothetical protein
LGDVQGAHAVALSGKKRILQYALRRIFFYQAHHDLITFVETLKIF